MIHASRRLILTTLAALTIAAPAALVAGDETAPAAAIDKPAPAFELPGIDGKSYKLSDCKGKYVVLEWNNFDCPFVKKHYGTDNMQALQKKYVEKGVVWLTICSSAPGKQGHFEPAALKTMTTDLKLAATAFLNDADGTVGKAYGAKTTPHMFVINPEGVLVYAGAIDDKPSTNPADVKGASNYVQASLDAAMEGKAIATRSTPPYGCSVKYAD
ncbi:MAG TPA: thioredoxin family protein [Candidatus Krumholzibacteria bacterium]|nr:thioredoxin family protein [Candidatus Krumholzibacteria bacterium]